jgi:hypothetical protein
MADRLVMSRLVRREDAGRDFDVELWQKLGDEKIFAAVWDLVVTAASMRGASDDQLRLQRHIAVLRGRDGSVSGSRRIRGDETLGALQHQGSGPVG